MSPIQPDWPAPENVLALSTTRTGGASNGPYESLNLAEHVEDRPESVQTNRDLLSELLPAGATVQWLRQVHGTSVLTVAGSAGEPVTADACLTRESLTACAVLTADCLPVLLCDRSGSVVAAAHAGWRGLGAGVLESTVEAMGVASAELMAWLGPAIGPTAFEVGPEVRQLFVSADPGAAPCFKPSPDREGHFLADLPGLARLRLANLGINALFGGNDCTYGDAERFFSYRRDGQTGRMASLILIK